MRNLIYIVVCYAVFTTEPLINNQMYLTCQIYIFLFVSVSVVFQHLSTLNPCVGERRTFNNNPPCLLIKAHDSDVMITVMGRCSYRSLVFICFNPIVRIETGFLFVMWAQT